MLTEAPHTNSEAVDLDSHRPGTHAKSPSCTAMHPKPGSTEAYDTVIKVRPSSGFAKIYRCRIGLGWICENWLHVKICAVTVTAKQK